MGAERQTDIQTNVQSFVYVGAERQTDIQTNIQTHTNTLFKPFQTIFSKPDACPQEVQLSGHVPGLKCSIWSKLQLAYISCF